MTHDHKILHFTLGPVQGFVAQARRTRDYWAGSFLLSWLAGHAMHATLMVDGTKITFPAVGTRAEPRDPLLAAICSNGSRSGPAIGTIPNRFSAEVPADFDVTAVRRQVREKWLELANAVWRAIPSEVIAAGNQSQTIWDRQVGSYWEMAWVLGDPDDDDGRWLDMRKNWRSHLSTRDEAGDHCTIMSDYQELSGFIRSHDRDRQDTFWQQMQQCCFDRNSERLGQLELRPGERLCAIALVKRLFPRLSSDHLRETIGFIPGSDSARIGKWPSTAYMSAVPWLNHIAQDSKRCEALVDYANEIQKQTGGTFKRLCSEQGIDIDRVKPVDRPSSYKVGSYDAYALDGNLWNEDALANPRATPLSDKPVEWTPEGLLDPAKDARQALLQALRQCNKSVGARAPSFYALMLFDGDRLGEILRRASEKAEGLSNALLAFAGGDGGDGGVSQVAAKHGGVTMYAGGDDMMALLPIDTAIQCAIDVRKWYDTQIDKVGLVGETRALATASAAIILAHFHLPLRDVIATARNYLDNIAKEKNGRDSLAIALFKNSGITADWVAKFDLGKPRTQPDALRTLQQAIADGDFSTGFFYNFLRRYPMLFGDQKKIGNFDAMALLVAEYCKGRPPKSETDRELARSHCQVFYDACRVADSGQLQIGGALIARFIVDTINGFSEGAVE